MCKEETLEEKKIRERCEIETMIARNNLIEKGYL